MKTLLPLFLAFPLFASAETYYVSSTGNDLNPGTQAQPFRQIRAALGVAEAGTVILVGNGDYLGFDAEDLAGTSTDPILIQATGNDAEIIPTTDRDDDRDTVHLLNCQYLILDGFKSSNANRAAIRIDVCDHVTVRNCVVANNTMWGIFTNHSDDIVLEGNSASGSQVEHGIYVSNSGDRPIVRGNTLFNNRCNGLHMNGDLSAGDGEGASDGDGLISGALVEGNIIYGNGVGGGSGINCDGVTNSVIRNNLLYANLASGISLYQIDGGDPSTNNVVVNNTVLVAGTGRWCLNILNASTGNKAYNNIFYNFHSFRGSIHISEDSLPGSASDYNVVMSRFTTDGGDTILTLQDWRTETGYDTHSIIATPVELFVNTASNDYHLNATSPAANVGTALQAPDEDIEGTARPGGGGYDIGAYERPGNDSTPPQILNRTPIPGSTGVSVGTTIAATFSEAIPPGSLNFVLRNSSGAVVPSMLTYDAATKTAQLDPSANLLAGATYTATISAAADLAGNPLAAPSSWSFTTAQVFANAFAERLGLVVFEAEHFSRSIQRGGRRWGGTRTPSGAVGTAMIALPEKGKSFVRGFNTRSPELQFRVYFSQPGKYYIWLRGNAKTAEDRMAHVGLDGRAGSTGSRIILKTAGKKWLWTNARERGSGAYLNVPSAGVHIVNLWMGDDGERVDRLLLTRNRAFKPGGRGPAESSKR